MSKNEDPLDELRESIDVAAKGTSIMVSRKRLKSYAEAWQAEREQHGKVYAYTCETVDRMQAKLDMSKNEDPLDELRATIEDHWPHDNPYWRDDPEKFGAVIDRFADAWQDEREQHGKVCAYMCETVDRMQAKLESITADRDEWRRTYKDVPPDVMQTVDELQAKLDVSMFVPLDADGVPCRIGDEMIDDGDQFTVLAVGGGCLADGDYFLHIARRCRHVSPKPETIEDVRESKDNLVVFLAQSGVMGWADLNSFSVDFSAVLDRAYECGRRDGAEADISGHCPKSDGTASIGNGTCPDGGSDD